MSLDGFPKKEQEISPKTKEIIFGNCFWEKDRLIPQKEAG